MNFLRKVYPLRLREKVYHLLFAQRNGWPEGREILLELAPAKLIALSRADPVHRQLAWLGFYERRLSNLLTRLARSGGVLIDVGANAGYFTVLWAAANLRNEVYAFEPSPRNLDMLRANVSALLNPDKIRVFDYALSKETGTFAFHPGPEEQTGWGGLSRLQSASTIQVGVRRLDEIVPPESEISVLKIDTEGADTWVIMGAEKLLRAKGIKHIFFERNDARMAELGIERGAAGAFLNDLDYRISSIGDNEFYAVPN